MNSPLDKAARLSRDVQSKIGEKLALLYVPVMRQRLPERISELLDRMEVTPRPGRADISAMISRLKMKIFPGRSK